MTDQDKRIRSLENRISVLENNLDELRKELLQARQDARSNIGSEKSSPAPSTSSQSHLKPKRADEFLTGSISDGIADERCGKVMDAVSQSPEEAPDTWPLSQKEYKRYGRQLIMPEVGLKGQLKLKAARVLIVGVGGLGCPAAAYLAGAGVGTIGLVDEDVVEESNLHRQILHSTKTIGMGKVDSAMGWLEALNPLIKLRSHRIRLQPDNALEIFASYDIVLDCTDTPASRYLISDTCILLEKPLVSASALRTEGQLMLFNYPAKPSGDLSGGPCYRCIFPNPPPPESVTSCGDGGILGPVVGVMGVLQALEAIKVITASIADTKAESKMEPPTLLLFSAYSTPQFRSIRLRSRNKTCAACSSQASVTAEALTSSSMDYVQFCGVTNPIHILSPDERVSATQYAEARNDINLSGRPHRIIDVREKVQYDLCHLRGSINIPFTALTLLPETNEVVVQDELKVYAVLEQLRSSMELCPGEPLYVICKLGNDSQVAVRKLKALGLDGEGRNWIGDVRGGLKAWRETVDPGFPEY